MVKHMSDWLLLGLSSCSLLKPSSCPLSTPVHLQQLYLSHRKAVSQPASLSAAQISSISGQMVSMQRLAFLAILQASSDLRSSLLLNSWPPRGDKNIEMVQIYLQKKVKIGFPRLCSPIRAGMALLVPELGVDMAGTRNPQFWIRSPRQMWAVPPIHPRSCCSQSRMGQQGMMRPSQTSGHAGSSCTLCCSAYCPSRTPLCQMPSPAR